MTTGRMKRMTLVQLVVSVVLGAVALIIVLQNTAQVETRVLFTTVTMSAALLLLCTLAIGFIAGVAATTVVIRKRAESE
jgi:uncharacterized integral membrane protein